MAAHILSLWPVADRGRAPAQPAAGVGLSAPLRSELWHGASGRRYMHTVYSLIGCPPLPKATYVLVRREADGRSSALGIASADSDASTLNLARVRQRGAELGANEVHVHCRAETEAERRLAVCDLRAGQFGVLGAEPSRASA